MPEPSTRQSVARAHVNKSPTAPSAAPGHSRLFTESLSRGLELLRCFSPSKPALTNKELALLTGLPKPTVSRLTYTMVELGYMRKEPDGRKFQLGSAALAIAFPMLASLPIRQVVRRQMQTLADLSGGVVGLFLCDRFDMVCIDAARHINASPSLLDIGATSPVWASAEGWAILAGLKPALRSERLSHIRQMHPDQYASHLEDLERALESVSTFGYCVSRSATTGDCHVSVPLRTVDDGDLMVITCTIPSATAQNGRIEQDIGPRLVTAVNNLNHSLS